MARWIAYLPRQARLAVLESRRLNRACEAACLKKLAERTQASIDKLRRCTAGRLGRPAAFPPERVEPLEPRMLLTAVHGVDLFYNDSAFDGNDAAITAEDFAAVATDKRALQELGQASFENYSSYHKGINGVMVEIGRRPYWAGDPTADDFIFRTASAGQADGDPFGWGLADAPTGFAFQPGDSNDGSGTVVMTWDEDSAVKNGWLQITVLPNENTQLRQRETFYLGSAIGETGDTEGSTRVNGSDYILARRNLHSLLHPAPIEDAYDINRDRKVDGLDLSLIRRNFTSFRTDLHLIAAPVNVPTHLSAQVYSHSEVVLGWHDQSDVEAGYEIMGLDGQGQIVYSARTVPDATGHLLEGLAAGSDYTFTVQAIPPDEAPQSPSTEAAAISFTTQERLTHGGAGNTWYYVTLDKGAPTRGEAGYGRSGALSVPAPGLVQAASQEVAALKALNGIITVIDYHTGTTYDFDVENSFAYKAGTKAALAASPGVTDFNADAIDAQADEVLVVLEDTYGFEAGTYADSDYDDWYWKVGVEEIGVNRITAIDQRVQAHTASSPGAGIIYLGLDTNGRVEVELVGQATGSAPSGVYYWGIFDQDGNVSASGNGLASGAQTLVADTVFGGLQTFTGKFGVDSNQDGTFDQDDASFVEITIQPFDFTIFELWDASDPGKRATDPIGVNEITIHRDRPTVEMDATLWGAPDSEKAWVVWEVFASEGPGGYGDPASGRMNGPRATQLIPDHDAFYGDDKDTDEDGDPQDTTWWNIRCQSHSEMSTSGKQWESAGMRGKYGIDGDLRDSAGHTDRQSKMSTRAYVGLFRTL